MRLAPRGRTNGGVRGRAHAVLLAALCVAVVSALACGTTTNDVHETEEAKSSTCITCHSGAYRVASNPVHVNKIPDTCQDCHSTKAWSPVELEDHFWWPLQNKHANLKCEACHESGFRAGDTSKDCQSCHRKDYDEATEPKHAGFPLDCTLCHTDTGFKPSSFKHPWPLDGAHATTPCASCHTGDPPAYKGTPTDCRSCHQADYDTAKNPIHQGVFATTCADCHTASSWRPSTYVHVWPLRGKHVLVPCNSCHTGSPPKYEGTATDCFGCHQGDYAASPFPNHGTFPHTCQDCHVMSGWKPAITGLHPESSFPIKTGTHADPRIKCMDCHVLAKGASTGGQNADCVNCHLGSHVRPAIDTKHVQLGVTAYPAVPTTTNFCLGCHPTGMK